MSTFFLHTLGLSECSLKRVPKLTLGPKSRGIRFYEGKSKVRTNTIKHLVKMTPSARNTTQRAIAFQACVGLTLRADILASTKAFWLKSKHVVD